MAFSLKQVRYFIATADSGQVSQAGMPLNVSQSAITAAIKQLEGDAGRGPVPPAILGRLADGRRRAVPAACAQHHGGRQCGRTVRL